ncbi:Oidioi.mRNA.OKI2018_I69.chr1.g3735.t2.cds [Oikopleura dioica]|uniref:Oidioi.mRNA.OKI2018_I69.chr1.g3735.t2.cds n=1 Tax=Oikopleura dioica TaxID=34765 RepID=A0ABN7SVM8_OIKDI|nr:Oidioi.mRNA.OKI2018_I69.chr1.g3735.t2.cds [Oikopleura dioica]
MDIGDVPNHNIEFMSDQDDIVLHEAPTDLFDFSNPDPFVVFGQSRPVRVQSAEVEQPTSTMLDDSFTTLEENPRLRSRSQTIPQHQTGRNPIRMASSSSAPDGPLPTLHENDNHSNTENRQRHRYLPYIPRNGRRERKGGNASPGTINGVHHTYQELIVIAITQSPNRCLTLAGIYQWMLENVREFQPNSTTGPAMNSWKNSIRHNLSLHKCFQKRTNTQPGESSLWVYVPDEPMCNQQAMYTDIRPNFNNNFASGTVLPTQSLQRRESQSSQIKVAPNFIYSQDKNLENIAQVVSESDASIRTDESVVLRKYHMLNNIISTATKAQNSQKKKKEIPPPDRELPEICVNGNSIPYSDAPPKKNKGKATCNCQAINKENRPGGVNFPEMQPGEISPISSGRDSPASPPSTADLQHMSPFIVDFPFSENYLSDVQSLQICP